MMAVGCNIQGRNSELDTGSGSGNRKGTPGRRRESRGLEAGMHLGPLD